MCDIVVAEQVALLLCVQQEPERPAAASSGPGASLLLCVQHTALLTP
jgi:hypothetical protein